MDPRPIARIIVPLAFILAAGSVRAAAPGYSIDTPIEKLAASPAAAAVVNRDVPDLLSNSNYDTFKTLSLRQVAVLSGGKLSRQMLNQTGADLGALPPDERAAEPIGYRPR